MNADTVASLLFTVEVTKASMASNLILSQTLTVIVYLKTRQTLGGTVSLGELYLFYQGS